jgi:hypothetical protein
MPFTIMGHNCIGSFIHWALCLLDFITPGHKSFGTNGNKKNSGICYIWDI